MSQLASLGQHSQLVREYISKNLPHVFSKQQLLDEVLSLKENKWVPKYMSPEETVKNLLSENIIEKLLVKGKNNNIERFATGEFTTIELAVTLLSRSWFSHYSALEIHRLVENNSSKIYITQEQSPKVFQKMDLVQDAVDKAFEKEQRPLNQIFKFKNKEYCLLKGKYSNRLGVMSLNYDNKIISVTDIERTLIDCVVRPAYSGDVKTIIEAFRNAREKVDVPKMFNYLNQLNHIYPYHQSIGFYLEYTGYSSKDWSLFELLPKTINFYLSYNITNKYLNRRWQIYIPDQLSIILR